MYAEHTNQAIFKVGIAITAAVAGAAAMYLLDARSGRPLSQFVGGATQRGAA